VITAAAFFAALSVWLWWSPQPDGRAITLGLQSSTLARLSTLQIPGRKRDLTSNAPITALSALAAELRAGQPPVLALQRTGQQVWPHAIAAAQLGGDCTAALRQDAHTYPQLQGLAACWEIATRTGSGMAITVQRLAESARATQETRVQLAAQLAGPKATARMLAALPLIGILLGHMLGADPVSWLLGSAFGLIALMLAVLFTGIGWWWITRIAASVEQQL
jgi:tight adherence protein B